MNKKGTIQRIVLLVVVFTIAAGAGLFFYFSGMSGGNISNKPVNDNKVAEKLTNNFTSSKKEFQAEIPALRDNCVSLPEKLGSCSAYKCLFLYEKDGRELVNEVAGLVNDKCQYKEQTRTMGMNLNCALSLGTRQMISLFYSDVALYNPLNQTGEPLVSDGKVYSVGGKNVTDPVLEAVLNGECKVE